MSSYLPDKTFVVCTNQLGIEYKQLTLSENRTAKSVMLGSQQRVFLVKLDKNLTSDFTCKSGWSSGAGTAAVGAGILTGLAVAATVAAVPVAGWIVGGVIAVGCLAYGIWQMMKSPTCSQMIGYEESQWINHHQTVRFDSSHAAMKEKHLALVKNSMLKCKEPGGILLPFISESAAKQAAEAIGYNNRREMATNIGAGFFTGFLFGTGIGGAAGTLAVLGQTTAFMGWTAAGHYIINPYVFSPATQKTNELANEISGTSESYDQIKNGSNQKPDHSERSNVPDPAANNDTIQTLYAVLKNMKQNGASKQQIAEINIAIAEAEKAGTYRVKDVPAVKIALENIKSGKYGDNVKEIFTNKSGNATGMNRQSNYESASNLKQEGIRTNNQENLKSLRNASVLVIAPFISSYFGNEAIRLGAELYDLDTSNSINVTASNY